MTAAGLRALTAGASDAPAAPGVYVFLGDDLDVLYVGKAGNIRTRLQQHAKVTRDDSFLSRRYQLVRAVRWEVLRDDDAACAREADLIVALEPPFNAGALRRANSTTAPSPSRPFIVVRPDEPGERLAFELRDGWDSHTEAAYGCFPHLGRGQGSRPGIACSDGYTAFLRLLWAASDEPGPMPSRITRAAPDEFTVAVDRPLRPPLHAFLSGVSRRLLDDLATACSRRDSYMQPALQRDCVAAEGFFAYGPRALRHLRLRHQRPPGPLTLTTFKSLVIAELREEIGDFHLRHR